MLRSSKISNENVEPKQDHEVALSSGDGTLTADKILITNDRHLKSEDFTWAICPVAMLNDLCLDYIAEHIIEIGIQKAQDCINETQWKTIMIKVPLNLPLKVTLQQLNDNTYWKRCCQNQYGITDDHEYVENYRKMYAELLVAETIESFVPYPTFKKNLNKVIAMCKHLVTSLDIKTLQLNKAEAIIEENDDPSDEADVESLAPYSPPNHIDVGDIFVRFPYLDKISLCISPRNCDLEFDYRYFQFTPEDGFLLTRSLRSMKNLRTFSLYGSNICCALVEDIASVFNGHPLLRVLDLSFNRLSGKCCKFLAQLLMSSCPLEVLLLGYNNLGNEGTLLLGAALTDNTILKILDLRLNGIEDYGGSILASCLEHNSSLQYLNMAGNKLGTNAGMAFAKVLEASKTLVNLNLSTNSLGPEVGQKLNSAMKINTTVTELDLRLCDLNEDDEIEIIQSVIRNGKSANFQ